MADEFELMPSLGLLELRESDLLVIKTTKRCLSQEDFARISDAVRDATGHGKVMVLEAGMELGALRSATSRPDGIIPRRLGVDDMLASSDLANALRFMGVYLDGVRQEAVLAYDLDAGFIERHAVDAAGHFIVDPALEELVVEKVFGTVTIEPLIDADTTV